MSSSVTIVDADGHYVEPMDMWAKYLDQRHLGEAPRLEEDLDGAERLVWPHFPIGPGGTAVRGRDRRGARARR